MSAYELGDAPIEQQYHDEMNLLARQLDLEFNGQVSNGQVSIGERSTGFVLLVFPFGSKDGRCNYISNGADRNDIVKLFREQIKRFEGTA
jgi:hypothetical protein